jgi:hypothetical protein
MSRAWRSHGSARLALGMLLLALSACVHRTGAPDEENELSVGPVPLTVDNRSQYAVSIYAVRGTVRQRVGEIAGTSQAQMVVPESLTNDHAGFALQVLQLAGPQRYVSDVVVPQRGDRLRLTVQIRLATSTLVVE